MRFLYQNECAEWCRARGAEIGEYFSLLPDPSLVCSEEIVFASQGSVGLEPQVARACLGALSDWDECLLWITVTGVWPSSEDWPAFYALRGVRGERQSVGEKPGHLFGTRDRDDLGIFLLAVLNNGWDAHLLPSKAGDIPHRFSISHDGWVRTHAIQHLGFKLESV